MTWRRNNRQLYGTKEGNVYGPVVIPTTSEMSLTQSQVESQFPSYMTISSISDTLTQTYSEGSLKLGWILGSFSILLLEPIILSLLKKEE